MMASFASVTALLFLAGLHSSSADILPKSMDEINLPSGEEWMSLSKSVDFMAAPTQDSPLLRSAQQRLLNFYKDDFADGLETQYNEYAQAWRYLGLYMDCGYVAQNRRLEQEAQDDGSICKRYLLWGAYVDLDYQGNGLSEYMIYNAETSSWDKSACNAGGSTRCVKMDCHSKGTNYKPLGFFRQDSPVEFMNILTLHQGSCSFSDGEANAMADGAEWLPQECTQSATMDGSSYIYFDLKPKSNGDIDVGLYTDAKCFVEYTGTAATAQDVLTTHYGYDVALQTNLAYINTALDAFKVCTPCRTFDLAYVAAEGENAEDDGSDPNNLKFVCVDDAGYSGTNQCMMFAKNTDISAAPISEVAMASHQGTITSAYASAENRETWWQAWGFFLMSVMVFLLGLFAFCSVAVKRKRVSSSSTKSEPLMAKQ